MKEVLKGKFYNITKGDISFEEVIQEMINWMKEKPVKFYDVIVGCDSSSSKEPNFPVAIVILRKGEGGKFFLKRVKYKNKKFFNWRERILEEVLLSCDMALVLREKLEKEVEKASKSNAHDIVGGERFNYEFRYIHADVGAEGKTKDMIKEVTGLILGNGFEPKIKPEAYVASIVADRFS